MTAKMKMIMHNTKVKLPRAPTVRPMIDMSKLRVGHDLASLNTRNWKKIAIRITIYKVKMIATTYQSERPQYGETLHSL
jgi:hypothetical protein